jgi:hypothetical protein
MAICPGALIVHADVTVMACTEDEEPEGCRGRDLRHEGDAIRCWTRTLTGCNYSGIHSLGGSGLPSDRPPDHCRRCLPPPPGGIVASGMNSSPDFSHQASRAVSVVVERRGAPK